MTRILSSEEIVKLTRKVAALYAQEEPNQTFGEWVLDKFYPGIDRLSLVNACSFVSTARTFDGRMYLSGMLHTGSLNPEPLLRALENVDTSRLCFTTPR